MKKLFIKILLCLLCFSYVAEHYLMDKQVTIVFTLSDQDNSEEKSEPLKEKSSGFEEDFTSYYASSASVILNTSLRQYLFNELQFLAGFTNTPFTPPDHV